MAYVPFTLKKLRGGLNPFDIVDLSLRPPPFMPVVFKCYTKMLIDLFIGTVTSLIINIEIDLLKRTMGWTDHGLAQPDCHFLDVSILAIQSWNTIIEPY